MTKTGQSSFRKSTVTVQEINDGKVEVAAIDSLSPMQANNKNKLQQIAEETRTKLKLVINRIQ